MRLSKLLKKYLGGQWSDSAPLTAVTAASEPQESHLLSRLPLEIRLQIWQEIIGSELLHMVITRSCPEKNSLKCFPCRAYYQNSTPPTNVTPSRVDAYPRCQGSQQEPCFFTGPAITPYDACSLLLSCRQIHNEAVGMLYTTNTFNIDNLEILQSMIAVLGPRLTSIVAVHVSTAMWKIHCVEVNRLSDAAFEDWKTFWQLMAEKMTGLQQLRLDIYGTSRAGLEKRDLEPLLRFRGLKSFDLALWQDTKDQGLPGQGSTVVGPMQTVIRSHACGAPPT
ncbi:MAG: hypothetical protein Q9208_007077 [Pyrenodesmia sp. 3 TL-2023]